MITFFGCVVSLDFARRRSSVFYVSVPLFPRAGVFFHPLVIEGFPISWRAKLHPSHGLATQSLFFSSHSFTLPACYFAFFGCAPPAIGCPGNASTQFGFCLRANGRSFHFVSFVCPIPFLFSYVPRGSQLNLNSFWSSFLVPSCCFCFSFF